MPGELSEALREAYATARSDVVYLDTLQISTPGIPTLWLVKDRVDHTFGLETGGSQLFTATAFRMSLPSANDSGLQDLSLSVDNVDRRASDFVKAALNVNKPIQVTYRPYMHSDPTQPQMNPPLVLFLTDVVITAAEVTGRATFADILNRKFLSDLYVRRRFPAL